MFHQINFQVQSHVSESISANSKYALYNNDDLVGGARLCLWTAATNMPIVHPPGDIWAWWNYIDRGSPDSSNRALWQFYQQSRSSKTGRTDEGNDDFCLTKYLFHTSKGSLTCREMSRHGAGGCIPPSKEGVLRIIALKNPSPSARFEPANFGSSGKHANH
jgi:hypothetical protein